MSSRPADAASTPGRRKRLALLGSRGIPARYGGFETFAEELSTRLVRAGVEVTVFCERTPGEPPAEHAGVGLEHVRAPGLGALGSLLYDLSSLWRARRGYDVVYMLGYGAGAFLWIPRLFGREVWVNMDGREWKRAKWGPLARMWLRWMERAALRAAHRIVFDSAAVRREVLGDAAPDARVHVIEYGAAVETEADDPQVLDSLGLRAGSYYLVIARIEPENHVLEIVRTVTRTGTQRELVVVGDLERGGRYARLCRREAGSRVRFLGAVFDRPALWTLRSQAWAVIHGHSVGGTNPALLEALAAGAPVVAHDNPFCREVLEDSARYFKDEGELSAAIRDCERLDDEERRAIRLGNRARIAQRYSWERITAGYVRLLGLEGVSGASAGARTAPASVESVPAALPGRAARSTSPASEERPG